MEKENTIDAGLRSCSFIQIFKINDYDNGVMHAIKKIKPSDTPVMCPPTIKQNPEYMTRTKFLITIINSISDDLFIGKDADCLKHVLRQLRNAIGSLQLPSELIELFYYQCKTILNNKHYTFRFKIFEICDMFICNIHNVFEKECFKNIPTSEICLGGSYDYDNLDSIYDKLFDDEFLTHIYLED